MRIGIIAALPGELKPLVRGWERIRGTAPEIAAWRKVDADVEVIGVCAGMGAEAARKAFVFAELSGKLDLVISMGWAGGLTDEANLGLAMSEVLDARTGERFTLTNGNRRLRVVTVDRVADATEKQRLWAAYGAVVVDMEAAAVARLAQMRGIPMCCFKAVSDEAGAKLPDFNQFIHGSGQMRMGSFALYVLARPRYWGPLLALGRRSRASAEALAEFVERFLVDRDFAKVNRTGGM